jgi:16S rRNA (cytosine1402-N4)-methyltransferase
VAALHPDNGGLFIDATFGAGGYTRLLLAHACVRVIGIDRDPSALAAGASLVAEAGGRLRLAAARFSQVAEVLAALDEPVCDGLVVDIGVSSMQFDEAARGFSFRFDAPLDMRMSGEGISAADIVTQASEADLADILFHYGEERRARQIARAITARRRSAPIATTRDLADLVQRLMPGRPGDIHPATRSFQALRIAVNDELGELARLLDAAQHVLAPGGHLAVVSFHSLEDRIVKTFLQMASASLPSASRHLPQSQQPPASFTPTLRKPLVADEAEVAANPRARSAKLRAARRTDSAPLKLAIDTLLPPVKPVAAMVRGG